MKRSLLAMVCLVVTAGFYDAQAAVPAKVSEEMAKEKGCLSCHEGIEDIREETSAMLAQTKGMGCSSCHNRGKRIGVTHQGLMEFPYGSPCNAKGGKQPKLHTKQYLFNDYQAVKEEINSTIGALGFLP